MRNLFLTHRFPQHESGHQVGLKLHGLVSKALMFSFPHTTAISMCVHSNMFLFQLQNLAYKFPFSAQYNKAILSRLTCKLVGLGQV